MFTPGNEQEAFQRDSMSQQENNNVSVQTKNAKTSPDNRCQAAIDHETVGIKASMTKYRHPDSQKAGKP